MCVYVYVCVYVCRSHGVSDKRAVSIMEGLLFAAFELWNITRVVDAVNMTDDRPTLQCSQWAWDEQISFQVNVAL